MIVFRETDDDIFVLDKASLKSVISPNVVINRLKNANQMSFLSSDDFRGANEKCWFTNEIVPEGMLFKQARKRTETGEMNASYYGELIVDLIAYHVKFPHTSYYPCQVILKDGTTLEGTLSPSYKQFGYNTEFSAENITTRYMKSQYDNNNGVIPPIEHNTVYEYIKQLRYLYGSLIPAERLEELRDYQLCEALVDYSTIQIDRHWGNHGYMTDNVVGISSILNIPMFDNECSFTLDRSMSSVEGFLRCLTMKDPIKKYIMPLTKSKDKAPLLGIKTSIVQLEKGTRLVNRKFKSGEPSNYDIFLSEMADEILQNEKVGALYKSLKELPLRELMEEAGYFPESITTLATTLYNARIATIEQALEQKRSENNESTSSL